MLTGILVVKCILSLEILSISGPILDQCEKLHEKKSAEDILALVYLYFRSV